MGNGFDYTNDLIQYVDDQTEQPGKVLRLTVNSSANINAAYESQLSAIEEENDIFYVNEVPVGVSEKSKQDFENRQAMHSSTSVDDNFGNSENDLLPFNVRPMAQIKPEVVLRMNQFRHKIKKPTIDIYWLFDDGGKYCF